VAGHTAPCRALSLTRSVVAGRLQSKNFKLTHYRDFFIVDNPSPRSYKFAGLSRNHTVIVDNMHINQTLPISSAAEGETLADHVLRQIQSAIVKGDIAPGSKISEPELARAYGISRGPLREALHRLEGQKLLVRVPHVGARVVSLNRQELSELYQIRESLEGLACRLAAERMTTEQVEELRGVLREHERDEAFQAGRGYYLQEGDFDFHYRIVQGSENRMLIRLLCDELYQLARMYRIQYSTTPNRPGQAFTEHHRILDAIADGDGELAEMLMQRHIRTSRLNIERHIP
jgi:DNA-binding GntR family transcriptional regulator